MQSSGAKRLKRERLEKYDVHVWFAFFEDLAPRVNSFLATLGEDEIEKAGRFKFKKDRDQYMLARGLLREILSQYTGIDPKELRFGYGTQGKPFLIPEPNVAFNLSHAQGAVLCAVAIDCAVGVDLEYLREDIDDQALAERCFSPSEVAALAGLSPKGQKKAFFVCWTRKEAYIKALGEGLSIDLRSIEVLDHPDTPRPLQIGGDSGEAARWTLTNLEVPAGYVAALAVEGEGHHVSCRKWPALTRPIHEGPSLGFG
jgi:4'-phosphopantetheinyl transferase